MTESIAEPVEEAQPDDGLTPINAERTTAEYLRDMWNRRAFAIEVPIEQMRSQHKTTLLGNVWHFGNPILTLSVYYFVFGTLLSSNRPDNFLLWLTVGLFAFQLTQRSMHNGAQALVRNNGLLKAIRFPRALLPVSSVVNNLLSFGIELTVLAVVVPLSGLGFSRRWAFLPLVLLIHTIFNIGAAFVAARLNDKYRDVEQLIPFLFQLLRYLSGVMIPIERLTSGSSIPAIVRIPLELNPMASIIEMYRWVFLAEPVHSGHVVTTTIISVGLAWFGFRFFRAAEWRYGRA